MARSGEGLSRQEIQGLKLFLGKAACVTCHSGPQFSDNHFHNTGVPEVAGLPPDDGRAAVLQVLKQGSFNCLGRYSDDNGAACRELRFMAMEEHVMLRAYKTPSLRGVASRAPYMHAGQFATLEQVLQHYSTAPQAPRGHSELNPLSLDPDEIAALLAFLRTLD
jgi:cytochrome c peroxidase